MDQFFSILKLHSLALIGAIVAFLFWKDYLTLPHQHIEKTKLAHITGTLSQVGKTMSLPSGTSTGEYILLKEAQTSFIPAGIHYTDFVEEVPEAAQITMSYNPAENPYVAGKGIQVFSVKYNNKEYIADADNVDPYNRSLDKKRNTAIYTTLAAVFAFVLVEVLRRKFLS